MGVCSIYTCPGVAWGTTLARAWRVRESKTQGDWAVPGMNETLPLSERGEPLSPRARRGSNGFATALLVGTTTRMRMNMGLAEKGNRVVGAVPLVKRSLLVAQGPDRGLHERDDLPARHEAHTPVSCDVTVRPESEKGAR